MAKFRVGFIGTGKKPEKPGLLGYAMAYRHAEGYKVLADCEIVACADIVKENREAFALAYGVKGLYADYHEMLAKEKLDLVSICTWPKLHAEMTLATIAAGVRAIHCEKPMALTFGDSRKMLQLATQCGTQLTFNHQRRFGLPLRKTRELLKNGAIGKLVRMEACMNNLYDTGTHWIDMLNYFNDETPAEWVIGQIDCREVKLAFGAPCEYQSICHVRHRNGVHSIITTCPTPEVFGPPFRVTGTDGVIEVGWGPRPGPMLRMWRRGTPDWEALDCKNENLHGPGYIERAIADVLDCLKTGREPELCARHAMNATEIIFGCWESSRRRARVDMPLDICDSPLVSMLESGEMKTRT